MTGITAVNGRPTSSYLEEICFSWRLRKRWIRQPLNGIGLRVCGLAVCIELRLQGFLVLLAIWPVARAMGTERYGRAGGTAGFDGDVRKPFGNAYRRFLHGTWVSTSTESTLLANVIGPRAPVCRPRPTRRRLAGKRSQTHKKSIRKLNRTDWANGIKSPKRRPRMRVSS